MKLEIKDKLSKKIISTKKDSLAILELLDILYTICIIKYKNRYRIHYKYNYSDIQKIFITDKLNNLEYIFSEVPTSWGYLDIYKL